MEIIINELSFGSLAENVYVARQRMRGLVETVRSCVRCGMSRVLRSDGDLYQVLLAEGYSVARWRNDREVDREVQRYFAALSTKAPLLDSDAAADIREKMGVSEFRLGGEEARGLGLALLMGTIAVSVFSTERWNVDNIEVNVSMLDDLGQITQNDAIVRHASRPEHLESHVPWIEAEKRKGVVDGDDLWTRRALLFPHLVFCDHLVDVVQPLSRNEPEFHSVANALFDLEAYFQTWNEGPFRPEQLGRLVSTESQATLQQFAQERTFWCPDGVKRLFSWHLRMTPGGRRLYFYPDDTQRICLIGYVGLHLRTAKYK